MIKPLSVSPDAGSEVRFQAYINALSEEIGHADRIDPLRSYCTGLLLPGERKSIEPMAARLDPRHVQATHQSLQGNRVKPIKSFLRTAITLWVMSARRSVLLSESRLKNRST